jgi:hypothetical protein
MIIYFIAYQTFDLPWHILFVLDTAKIFSTLFHSLQEGKWFTVTIVDAEWNSVC